MVLVNLFKESGKFRLGVVITFLLLFCAVIHQPLVNWRIGDKDPMQVGLYPIFLDPSNAHPLGTDRFGRDVLSLVLIALPVSLLVAFLAGAISTTIGVVVGFAAGYKGGRMDSVLRTITDIFIVIPTLPLIIVLAANTRNLNSVKLALVLAAFGWPVAARVIRTQVMSLRERPYIELSKMTNLSDREIIVGDVLPNMAPFVAIGFAQASVGRPSRSLA